MKVSDLSTDELRSLIRETITETLADLVGDEDEGLHLREDVVTKLRASLENREETVSAEQLAERLGLRW